MDRNSWRIITGQEVKPDDSASAKEKRNLESRWDRAYSTIYLSIEKEYRNLISDTCDPIVAWKKLQDHFQPHTRARVIGLLQFPVPLKTRRVASSEILRTTGLLDEFFNCRILEEEEIGLYAAHLRTIVFQLRDAGHPLEDLYQAFQLIRSSQNESIRGIPKLKSINVEFEDCKIGKTSHDGSNYFLSITDDYSRKVTVFPIKRKPDVFNCFTRHQKRAERFLNNKVVNIRIDNGLELIHKEFRKFLDSQGIEMERTNTYSPEMNGVSERFNYTASDAIRAMLRSSGLSNKFWSEASPIRGIAFVIRTRQNPLLNCIVVKKPSVKHLRTFGCEAYVGVPKQLRNKLNMKGGKDKYSGPVPKGESSTSEYNNHEAHHVEVVIPRNFKEASLSPDKDKWFVAMKEEINIMSER
ncbi:retrovirus-related Pol polyprotein from transposon TNT 1-94 [Trichonephila clavipes]|nr:retrovirus-related Pol polyprotein from transposon TNT 1-94 [Trichonephila clavipes]